MKNQLLVSIARKVGTAEWEVGQQEDVEITVRRGCSLEGKGSASADSKSSIGGSEPVWLVSETSDDTVPRATP